MNEQVIVCGGPHHGQKVDDAGSVWSPLVMMQDSTNPSSPPFAAPTNYFRKFVEGQSPAGNRLRRAVYAHEGIQDPQQLMMALSSILIAAWMAEGGEVVDGVVLDQQPVPVKRSSGLILPGQ